MTAALADATGLSPEEVERQFNPRVAVPDFERHIAEHQRKSAAARARLEGALDLRYGPGPKETLDVFPASGATGPAPVLLYLHGGYWRGLDKADFSHLAGPLVGAGATAVVVNYDLCPDVTVPDIVAEARRAIAWTHANIAGHGGDPARLHVCGSSAGAHLCAMALARDWAADGLPDDLIAGATLITGIYDVSPVLGISVNEEIRMTEDMVAPMSPMRLPPRRALPVLIAVGGAETPRWIAQSRAYADECRRHGLDPDYLELPGENHFSVTATLADPAKPLLPAVLRQMGLAKAG